MYVYIICKGGVRDEPSHQRDGSPHYLVRKELDCTKGYHKVGIFRDRLITFFYILQVCTSQYLQHPVCSI